MFFGRTLPAAAGATHAQEAIAPVRPSQLLGYDSYYYDTYIIPGGDTLTPELIRSVLGPRYYSRTGNCANYPSNDLAGKLIRDDTRGHLTVMCAKKNGKNITQFVPRRRYTYPSAAKIPDFRPDLYHDGDTAAASVGVTTNQYGRPNQIEIDINRTAQTTVVDIRYTKGSVAGVRQLEELQLRIVRGAETFKEVWYP